MKGIRAIGFLFVALIAGAAWWVFSGGYGHVSQVSAEGEGLAGKPEVASCVPKPPTGAIIRDIPWPKSDRVHWVTWGTGEFARAFRVCVEKGNECKTNTPSKPVTDCSGGRDVQGGLVPGASNYETVSAVSAINPQIFAFDGLHWADSTGEKFCPDGSKPPCPPLLTQPPPGKKGLSEPKPVQQPKYHEL